MKIENHILSVLQLYEFSMAIGRTLNYEDACDQFLKIILKRKNLNAGWILEYKDDTLDLSYSLPLGKAIQLSKTHAAIKLLQPNLSFQKLDFNTNLKALIPIDINDGYLGVFNLKDVGFLFLYSKKDNITRFQQLQPVIDKFTIALKACKAFKKQQELLVDLESRNQELSDYAHMVSHDLKSPLRSIDSLTAWLKEDYNDQFDAHGKKSLTLIRDHVEKMDKLINGILQYSTINKNQYEVYDVNIDSLVDHILQTIQIPAHITVKKAVTLPTIKGDKFRLQQLFQNLIDNAIKYNDKQNGIIEIDCEALDTFWQFKIKDNGKGIAPKYHKRIFKTFEKLENNVDSSGIGLSIVKKVVNLYEGKIWIESALNKGTTFFFTLKR